MTNPNNAAQAVDQEIEAIMEQAQVFASAWSFLGGPFDNGSGLETAEREKANLRALLSKLRAAVADERISLRGAANLAFNAPHECKPAKGAEKQYSDAIQALQSALHDIAYMVNRTATPQQFADHLQREARAALESTPVADRQRLRDLVDAVWNEATESTAVPSTPWADRLIDKVFPSLAVSAPVAGEAVACLRRRREGSEWGHWTPATVEDGQRVTGLRSWQVRWLVDAAPQACMALVEIRLPYGTPISGWLELPWRDDG
ncbi:hypothetical protein [Achromobacter xylosoxidans]|uniref:hypothetical protein n=1 Tax=Alcaligenes xylosoxydans xylosoxydans TaxID=85698 RepID=UPI001F139032|nr:hypothetical protein [Achromobacter xylosoxidans]